MNQKDDNSILAGVKFKPYLEATYRYEPSMKLVDAKPTMRVVDVKIDDGIWGRVKSLWEAVWPVLAAAVLCGCFAGLLALLSAPRASQNASGAPVVYVPAPIVIPRFK